MPETNYIWDPLSDSYLMESDENHAVTAVYTVEPEPFGKVISQRRGDETSYYHYDGLGSTRQLTDAIGMVTDTNLYDAWGVDVASSGTTENPFQWVGELGYYWDSELDQQYVRARLYQPPIGRWTAVDPYLHLVPMLDGTSVSHLSVTAAAVTNRSRYSTASLARRYDYCHDAPVCRNDPSGMIPANCIPKCPSWCGPDIGNKLVATLRFAESEWHRTNWFVRQYWCAAPGTWLQWDLHDDCWSRSGASGKCGTCCIKSPPNQACCVDVFGFRHNQWTVNYVLWGAMMGLCRHTLADAILTAHVHKTAKWLAGLAECGHEATDTLDKWIEAGYRFVGGSGGQIILPRLPLTTSMPHYNDPNFDACLDCPPGYETPFERCGFTWFNGNSFPRGAAAT